MNFGEQPVWLIEQAMETGHKIRQKEHHYSEVPFANFVTTYWNSKRDPKKPPLKPHYYYRPKGDDIEGIPIDLCDIIVSLLKSKLLPQWVYAMLPTEVFNHTISFGITYPRVYLNSRLIVIKPSIRDGWLTGGLLLSNSPRQVEKVTDPDDKQISVLVELTEDLIDTVVLIPQVRIVDHE